MNQELQTLAERFISLYAETNALTRPLTSEQIKDACVCFLDLASERENSLDN